MLQADHMDDPRGPARMRATLLLRSAQTHRRAMAVLRSVMSLVASAPGAAAGIVLQNPYHPRDRQGS